MPGGGAPLGSAGDGPDTRELRNCASLCSTTALSGTAVKIPLHKPELDVVKLAVIFLRRHWREGEAS